MNIMQSFRQRPPSLFRAFITGEASGGIILMLAAVAGLIVANSALAPGYFSLLKTYVWGPQPPPLDQ